MKDSKKDPMVQGNKGSQQTQSNQPNRGNPQKGTDEGKPAWKPGNEKSERPERGEDEHLHENKQPVSDPKGVKRVYKPGDTATGTTQEGSTGTEKSKKKTSSDSMGDGSSGTEGGSDNGD